MILVLAGTSEGRQLMEMLHSKGHPYIGTVTTSYGKDLLQDIPHVICCQLDEQKFLSLIKGNKISKVVDCTHPYAVNISKLAIRICYEQEIPYVRYERSTIESSKVLDQVQWVDSYEQVASILGNSEGNVLVSIGSKRLHLIAKGIDTSRLYPRVLPTEESIRLCRAIGIQGKQIIAVQGPFTEALNKAIYEAYHIKILVTKESGSNGGTEEKIRSAMEMGILPIVIRRPKLNYPKVIRDFSELDIMEVQKNE